MILTFDKIKNILRKIFFYFILWTGMILTSMFFDKFTKISDEEGYLAGLIIWLFLIFIIEFLIPFIKSRN